MKKRFLSVFLLAIFISTIVNASVFASSLNVDKWQSLNYQEVGSYIQQSTDIKTVEFSGLQNKSATYYSGDGYMVVQEGEKFSLITYNESRTEIYVNGRKVNIKIVDKSQETSRTTSYDWIDFRTKTYYLDVGGMGYAVASGVISTAIGVFISPVVGDIVDVGLEILGRVIFPDGHFIVIDEDLDSRVVDAFIGVTEWRGEYEASSGPNSNPTRDYLGDWTTYRTNYQ